MLRRFRSQRPEGQEPTGVDLELQSLERESRAALPGLEAQALNRAGDLCLQVGQRARAFRYFGRAIDSNLRAHRFDAAAAICRKLLRIAPETVRARCTLAWLSIGKGHVHDAQREVTEYVLAARKAGQGAVARRQLLEMARVAQAREFRALLAIQLQDVGDPAAAEEILAWLEEPDQAPPPLDGEERWARVVSAALMGPDELLLGTGALRRRDRE
jgi:tetratricopeptide (TPR) repeat protein